MVLCGMRILSTLTILYLLVLLTFTAGHEGNTENAEEIISKATANNTQTLEATSAEGNNSYDYEWHNHDDYLNDDYHNDETQAYNETAQSGRPDDDKDITRNKTETSTMPSNISAVLNSTVLENDGSKSSAFNESINSTTHSGSSVFEINKTESSSTEIKLISDASFLTSTEKQLSSVPGNGSINSTEKASPSPIITQDVGDVSNYTSSNRPILDDDINSSALQTWTVVVFSILISFAAIFTILFFIRGELIRRRKADQRRLLRGSISSEGYFYGDGEGNTTGKYEL